MEDEEEEKEEDDNDNKENERKQSLCCEKLWQYGVSRSAADEEGEARDNVAPTVILRWTAEGVI